MSAPPPQVTEVEVKRRGASEGVPTASESWKNNYLVFFCNHVSEQAYICIELSFAYNEHDGFANQISDDLHFYQT